ncbi:MAG: SGNH/GDSL hydrolase family protein [Deltaproteobacteria bacterium]|nr:SGNH/GDSL hydrolase family protein [Deltaproteobacteria bacterium]
MRLKITVFLLLCMLFSIPAQCQLVEEFDQEDSSCCLPIFAQRLVNQLQDWNQLSRYQDENRELKKKPYDPKRVVFMGDSITDFWKLAEYFPEKPYINRGISGQTTPQMLVRMYPDVIQHKPVALVVLAGINDISQNTGPATAEMVEENIMAMTDLAQHNGIKVILCSILPVNDYAFLKQQASGKVNPYMKVPVTAIHPPEDILKLNAWMKQYAEKVNAIYVDYFSAMVDEKGFLKDNLSGDGIHPNAEGYKIMTKIIEKAIEKVLK